MSLPFAFLVTEGQEMPGTEWREHVQVGKLLCISRVWENMVEVEQMLLWMLFLAWRERSQYRD